MKEEKKVSYANKFERCWVKQSENHSFAAGFLGASSAQRNSQGTEEHAVFSPGPSVGS